jgi:hypothetical protein
MGVLEGEGEQGMQTNRDARRRDQQIFEDLYALFASWEGPRPMSAMSPGQRRIVRRLTLASVLVVVVGLTLGLDSAMAVAFSLAVMEIDAVNP